MRLVGRAAGAWQVGLGAIAVCLLLSGVAQAKGKPSVSLTFAGGTREGASVSFTWASKHIGKRVELVIQRPVGTAHVWRSVKRLTTRTGSDTLPPAALGRYRYRLAAIRGHKVVAKQAAWVSVYGQVPFSKLFNRSTDVHVTPTASFPFVWESIIVKSSHPTLEDKQNRCLAVHVDFVTQSHSDDIVVSVVQETRDPVSAAAPADTISSVEAQLTPGQTWAINAYASSDSHVNDSPWANLFLNGYAICDSLEASG